MEALVGTISLQELITHVTASTKNGQRGLIAFLSLGGEEIPFKQISDELHSRNSRMRIFRVNHNSKQNVVVELGLDSVVEVHYSALIISGVLRQLKLTPRNLWISMCSGDKEQIREQITALFNPPMELETGNVGVHILGMSNSEYPKSVLIVDADKTHCDFLRQRLSGNGYTVYVAHDGEQAIQIFDKFAPRIVVSELDLLKVDAITLIRHVMSETNGKGIVVILSHSRVEEDMIRCFKLGVSDYMTKPFSPAELIARIERFSNVEPQSSKSSEADIPKDEETTYEKLHRLIDTRQACVAVIGLGYVGLPLALLLTKQGYNVIGIDVDEDKVQKLSTGESCITGVSDSQISDAICSGRLTLKSDYKSLATADAISICVPTPLSKNFEPDISYVRNAVGGILQNFDHPVLITLESTTYPGTTREMIQARFAEAGYCVGQDFFLCYSPERVDPANQMFNTENTPKLIGGSTKSCLSLGTLLYSTIVQTMVAVTSTEVAEMSKLWENTFRSVNIALANELAMMCSKMGIDVWEVIDAAATKPFGFMPFYPGPGIGGHCIPLDPMYLSWKAKEYNFYSKFIDLAQSINRSMPEHVVNLLSDVLNLRYKSIRGSRILLLGITYKPDVSDLRESPAIEVYELLVQQGSLIDYFDPFAPHFVDANNQLVESISNASDRLKHYDCIVLLTKHSCLDYAQIARAGVPIIDTRNALKGLSLGNVYTFGVFPPLIETEVTKC